MKALFLLFIVLAGACKAIKDTLDFHYECSWFRHICPKFFSPSISWKNKYKNYPEDKSSKFFGSKTFLVWLTDGWHLFDMLSYALILTAAALNPVWWLVCIGVVLFFATFQFFWWLFTFRI